jgi:DNA-binding HxlR family transcriptional regulator
MTVGGFLTYPERYNLLSADTAMHLLALIEKEGPCRYDKILKKSGINHMALSYNLRELSTVGYIDRELPRSERKYRVVYSITKKGTKAIKAWFERPSRF